MGTPQNAGMYVKSLLHGIETNFLVDTGATLSVLSRKVYDSLIIKTELYHTDQVIFSAGGTTLNVLGKTLINIEIGDVTYRYTQDVIIADLLIV